MFTPLFDNVHVCAIDTAHVYCFTSVQIFPSYIGTLLIREAGPFDEEVPSGAVVTYCTFRTMTSKTNNATMEQRVLNMMNLGAKGGRRADGSGFCQP